MMIFDERDRGFVMGWSQYIYEATCINKVFARPGHERVCVFFKSKKYLLDSGVFLSRAIPCARATVRWRDRRKCIIILRLSRCRRRRQKFLSYK